MEFSLSVFIRTIGVDIFHFYNLRDVTNNIHNSIDHVKLYDICHFMSQKLLQPSIHLSFQLWIFVMETTDVSDQGMD